MRSLLGASLLVAAPLFANVVTLDGTTDSFDCRGGQTPDYTNGITMTGWAKPSDQGSGDNGNAMILCMIGWPGDSSGDFLCAAIRDNDGTANCTSPSGADGCWAINTKSGGTITETQSTVGYEEGTWYFMAFVYDGTDLHLYINGTQRVNHAPANTTWQSQDRCGLGGRSTSSSDVFGDFAGKLASVGIWEDDLTNLTAQIRRCGPGIRAQDRFTWWRITQKGDAGEELADASKQDGSPNRVFAIEKGNPSYDTDDGPPVFRCK